MSPARGSQTPYMSPGLGMMSPGAGIYSPFNFEDVNFSPVNQGGFMGGGGYSPTSPGYSPTSPAYSPTSP
eukprot:CAMPEP_0197475630 /NCGR_PEP_ID=MMETSP1309-20131121/7081_1 /TAXON_ID=464262 /ORGANISM="Genus nov. species nov., Strain RCC998" /LENGTH=69 /DNA_ID=CAMNT_0043015729 /DNA_START=1 /DNA_END=206 /DNA_ORIENTATION=+